MPRFISALVTETHKHCSKCDTLKLRGDFYKCKNGSAGLTSMCKPCSVARRKIYYESMPIETKRRYNADAVRVSKQLRYEALVRYSNDPPFCSCCKEDQYEFLSLDHINGNGTKHRKEVGGGARFTKWLKKNNYPEGYQVLCHNCNQAKGFHGMCPHQRKLQVVAA